MFCMYIQMKSERLSETDTVPIFPLTCPDILNVFGCECVDQKACEV